MDDRDRYFFENNTVSLKDFLLSKLKENERAIKIARMNLEKRLKVMNKAFIKRKELDIILDTINKDKKSDISILLSILAIILVLISIFIKV